MEQKKPVAVLVTSFLPYPGMGGSHMRAWDWLKTLSRDYRVHVIVTSDHSDESLIDENYPAERVWNAENIRLQKQKTIEKWFKWPFMVKWNHRHIRDLSRIDPDQPFSQELMTSLREADLRHVLIYKLQNYEFGTWFAKTFPNVPVELDMDDYESRSRQSIGQAYLRMGKNREGKRLLQQARQYHILETAIQGPYQCLYLANQDDCRHISSQLAPRIAYRPNRITVPDTFPAPPEGRTELLFIGTLHYLPNVEAIHFLINELVPVLRRVLDTHWHLTIAGRSPADEIRQLCENVPEITLMSDIETLVPLYEQAHIVLVPLFSGSGTKLKTLEAMAYRRTIVSTSEGVRGLNLENGKHYLHAETATGFASAIKKLASNTDQASLVAQQGYEYCLRTFAIVS